MLRNRCLSFLDTELDLTYQRYLSPFGLNSEFAVLIENCTAELESVGTGDLHIFSVDSFDGNDRRDIRLGHGWFNGYKNPPIARVASSLVQRNLQHGNEGA